MSDESTAVAVVDELFAPEAVAVHRVGEAGFGSEAVEGSDVLLPRITLLQAMSKPVVAGLPGAKAGVYWLMPHNRPVIFNPDEKLSFVVVKMYPAQRKWTPLDEGGGLECEAPGGDYIAREALGISGATPKLIMGKVKGAKNESIVGLEWVGGTPTNDCRTCQYGPGAGPNGWMPKIIEIDGESVRLPDEARRPRCTHSMEVLVLAAIPAWEGLAQSIEPAFLSFAKTSSTAGKQLSGMVKMGAGEPAWAKLYALASMKVSNDKGTFFVMAPTVRGYSRAALMDRARALYDLAKDKSFRPAADPDGEPLSPAATDASPPSDDAAAPADKF
jgi:hypothetical protein